MFFGGHNVCFVLDRLSVFVNVRRRHCHTGWAEN